MKFIRSGIPKFENDTYYHESLKLNSVIHVHFSLLINKSMHFTLTQFDTIENKSIRSSIRSFEVQLELIYALIERMSRSTHTLSSYVI